MNRKERQMAKKSKPAHKRKKKYARTGKILTDTLYLYVEPGSKKHAISQGKKPKYGTVSGYVNALIAKDRGVKPKRGTRGQGELKRAKKPAKKLPKFLRHAKKAKRIHRLPKLRLVKTRKSQLPKRSNKEVRAALAA